MKTPEELAEEWVSKNTTGSETYEHGLRNGFLAGYKAAQHKDKAVNRTHLAWKLAQDYGAVKWLKHKDYKRFGNTERDYEYTIARDGFYQGYQAAREHAHAALEEAEVKLDQAPQWISVKDRLPEDASDVLIAWADGVSEGCFCDERWRREGRMLRSVTHWMPLPKPPEE
jgi:hypothetical protein